MSEQQAAMQGACHCGTVQFTVVLKDGLRTARRCNCSLCSMRGAVAVSAMVGQLTVTAGMDALTLYQFNTMQAKHWFCSTCGIYTHHQRRSNPHEYGVNVACLAGVSPSILPSLPSTRAAAIPLTAAPAPLPAHWWPVTCISWQVDSVAS
ncbi:GFA family protein [Massilia sp. PWRC2]|uniref:GFA family protein n=1 Tax=Massilia sp. PWRC2 TaxID=2804626 RepID=UPI003CEE23C4